ncbi:MAG: hypothetical protein KatS3mg015_2431 [Fimbriimonadales bacterium]|nr:MAG: hypothetical protein KatS3mg015_2431 [Fimbriimonadales bacterium]
MPHNISQCDPSIDFVINPPRLWWEASQRRKLKYFIPDWDDLVDPEFDFEQEMYAKGGGGWMREVFAHQLYGTPCYDGILVSREVIEKSKKKKQFMDSLVGKGGIHRYLRVPANYPVMGDCGAFGYAKEETPPYSTEDVLDYYTRLGFNFGVSIDHLVPVAPTPEQQRARYELTIENADAFLKEHRARDLSWTPIGAVQGWDPDSYRAAARRVVAMGYDYIALGGLVRSQTTHLLRVVEAVKEVVPSSVRIHVFGVARIEATRQLVEFGITSIDSASPLRKAWLDSNKNYWSLEGIAYAALRVPNVPKHFMEEDAARAKRLEQAALHAIRSFDQGNQKASDVLEAMAAYHETITPDRTFPRDHYKATLEGRPWQRCPCTICQQVGVEVIIFRGNNRNRRRGFHNTYVFYELLGRSLAGEQFKMERAVDRRQVSLFQ